MDNRLNVLCSYWSHKGAYRVRVYESACAISETGRLIAEKWFTGKRGGTAKQKAAKQAREWSAMYCAPLEIQD